MAASSPSPGNDRFLDTLFGRSYDLSLVYDEDEDDDDVQVLESAASASSSSGSASGWNSNGNTVNQQSTARTSQANTTTSASSSSTSRASYTAPQPQQQQQQQSLCCCICFEKVDVQEDACALLCGHIFHDDCIQSWLKIKLSCPMCKSVPHDFRKKNKNFPVIKLYATHFDNASTSNGGSGSQQVSNSCQYVDHFSSEEDQVSNADFEQLKVTLKNLRHDLSNAVDERDALRTMLDEEFNEKKKLEEENKHLDRKCTSNDVRLHKKEEEIVKLQRQVKKLKHEVSEWKSRGSIQKYSEDLDLPRTLEDLQTSSNNLDPHKKVDRLFRLCKSQHTLLKERTDEVSQARKQVRKARETASRAEDAEQKAVDKKKFYHSIITDLKEKLSFKNKQIKSLRNQLNELGIEPTCYNDEAPFYQDEAPREEDARNCSTASSAATNPVSMHGSAPEQPQKRRRSALTGSANTATKRSRIVANGAPREEKTVFAIPHSKSDYLEDTMAITPTGQKYGGNKEGARIERCLTSNNGSVSGSEPSSFADNEQNPFKSKSPHMEVRPVLEDITAEENTETAKQLHYNEDEENDNNREQSDSDDGIEIVSEHYPRNLDKWLKNR
eukprot:gb/GECG01000696.1/.p1 GENE.gb/GECG01000696.1/~~gb/GECG01000696.1/.p1  ORF type:complete len:611 (+),score=115.95 gb/GECG01000696.1/:1-1833(+)